MSMDTSFRALKPPKFLVNSCSVTKALNCFFLRAVLVSVLLIEYLSVMKPLSMPETRCLMDGGVSPETLTKISPV